MTMMQILQDDLREISKIQIGTSKQYSKNFLELKGNNMEDTERLVKAIAEEKNLDASKHLENILKKKCAKHIADILKA